MAAACTQHEQGLSTGHHHSEEPHDDEARPHVLPPLRQRPRRDRTASPQEEERCGHEGDQVASARRRATQQTISPPGSGARRAGSKTKTATMSMVTSQSHVRATDLPTERRWPPATRVHANGFGPADPRDWSHSTWMDSPPCPAQNVKLSAFGRGGKVTTSLTDAATFRIVAAPWENTTTVHR